MKNITSVLINIYLHKAKALRTLNCFHFLYSICLYSIFIFKFNIFMLY